jgi:hypothetical protein
MTENEVEAGIVRFLRERGWVVDRNHVGGMFTRDGRPMKIGRNGQCDWRAARDRKYSPHYLEVEIKATGKKPAPAQREYMALRSHQGILVTWADSLEMFARWYNEQVGV